METLNSFVRRKRFKSVVLYGNLCTRKASNGREKHLMAQRKRDNHSYMLNMYSLSWMINKTVIVFYLGQ